MQNYKGTQITFDEAAFYAGINPQGNQNKVEVLQWFAQSIYKTIKLPNEWSVRLDEPIVFDTKKGITGEQTALGTDRPKIIVTKGIGLQFNQGARISNLSFAGGEGVTSVWFGGVAATGNEDDVDGSVQNCTFNIGKRSTAIVYNGRNARILNNAFSDGVGGTCISLRWHGIDTQSQEPGDLNETSWRKNRVIGNQFHTGPASKAVVINGDYPIYGFQLLNNIMDIGGQMLVVERGGMIGSTVTGNSWYGRSRFGAEGVLEFKTGVLEGLSITGNGFTTLDGPNKSRCARFVNVASQVDCKGLAISTNSFINGRKGKAAVAVHGDTSKVIVIGNVITNSSPKLCGNGGVSFKSETRVHTNV